METKYEKVAPLLQNMQQHQISYGNNKQQVDNIKPGD